MPRFWQMPSAEGERPTAAGRRFLSLENLVALFLDHLFPGCRVEAKGLFRLIRDSDVEMEEEAEGGLLRVENTPAET